MKFKFYKLSKSRENIEYKQVKTTYQSAFNYFNKLNNVYQLVIYNDNYKVIKSICGHYNVYEYLKNRI